MRRFLCAALRYLCLCACVLYYALFSLRCPLFLLNIPFPPCITLIFTRVFFAVLANRWTGNRVRIDSSLSRGSKRIGLLFLRFFANRPNTRRNEDEDKCRLQTVHCRTKQELGTHAVHLTKGCQVLGTPFGQIGPRQRA
jgi:hypothetical protein